MLLLGASFYACLLEQTFMLLLSHAAFMPVYWSKLSFLVLDEHSCLIT
jgi:hypothetical protein